MATSAAEERHWTARVTLRRDRKDTVSRRDAAGLDGDRTLSVPPLEWSVRAIGLLGFHWTMSSPSFEKVESYLETADVAKAEGLVPATIRADVAAGRLKVAATTKRGTRLFRAEDVEEYRKTRRARIAGRRTAKSK